ncbi:T9SS type B sorting domain-containing protein [Seonamhaeicola marinus]|uniref:T9SS type B sorting domain-containing protein n=1 Tax=Seonamhaeicola marinus TaxID=1912246 RepID=A0A5D0HSJ8_9FLAO|nr:T9SS type B sorting domain-containing protein [Seonamhaeicola marinus]TYA74324.1 T9SS type B sorting domain-containing protein [Seonamhaeicola marinus]
MKVTIKTYLTFLLLLFIVFKVEGQWGCCSFKKGDTIYSENFGHGPYDHMSKKWWSPSYSLLDDGELFEEGKYSITDFLDYQPDWIPISNHTPEHGSGNMMVINGDFNDGEFFSVNISGLEEETYYEFSAWVTNLTPKNAEDCEKPIPYAITFEASTSFAFATSKLLEENKWERFFLVFFTRPGETQVRLRIKNTLREALEFYPDFYTDCSLRAPSIDKICGNYLAIDDIVVKSCGGLPSSEICEEELPCEEEIYTSYTDVGICEGDNPTSVLLEATPSDPSGRFFGDVTFQWQESSDENNWFDIPGENDIIFNAPLVNGSFDKFYRVILRENSVFEQCDILSKKCPVETEYFNLKVAPIPDAPISLGDKSYCLNETPPILEVEVPNGIAVNWYLTPSGGESFYRNNSEFIVTESGTHTYYAEAVSLLGGCESISRTPVTVVQKETEIPIVEDETLEFCEDTSLTLSANVINANAIDARYLWDTGEVTESITVNKRGIYSVTIFHEDCYVTKSITVNQRYNPVIREVTSKGKSIVVSTWNRGDFLYSLDGFNFQMDNTFHNKEGGAYTVYVKERYCNEVVRRDYIHFYIPKYFTPNGDNENDTFILKGIELYSSSSVEIFDRYGKLLKSSKNSLFEWDGTHENKMVPPNDYWYIIVLEGKKITGHFTLKR